MRRFDELLSEMVDVTMKRIFGESGSALIYGIMERHVSLKREEVGEKVETFHAYVRKLVGPEITQIILATGLKVLCTELRREYEEIEEYFSLVDELYEIKLNLLAQSLKEERQVCN